MNERNRPWRRLLHLLRLLRLVACAWVAAAVAGCALVRPSGPPDALDCGLRAFEVQDTFSDWGIYQAQKQQLFSLQDAQPSFNVLALSAGGQFGAYGAGFLVGWGQAGAAALPGPRADVQVVTGVSTGAILATHAFLQRDAEIEARYLQASGPGIYRLHGWLGLLRSNALADDSGKEALIRDNISSSLIDAVAASPAGRFLYLGVVNLDDGRFMRIDMVKLARTLSPVARRDGCYRAVVSASSAIPIAFPPKFVDDMMLTDGGARRHLFITQPPPAAMAPGVTRRLISLVHGDLDVGRITTPNGLLGIAGRAAELFSDQSFKDSIRLAEQLAGEPATPATPTSDSPTTPLLRPQPLFRTYYAAAAKAAQQCAPQLAQCPAPAGTLSEDLFCQPFMACLAAQGRADGLAYATGQRPWPGFAELWRSAPDQRGAGPAALKRRPGQ